MLERQKEEKRRQNQTTFWSGVRDLSAKAIKLISTNVKDQEPNFPSLLNRIVLYLHDI